MLPAPAGMSLGPGRRRGAAPGAPRTCGDEPSVEGFSAGVIRCSPHLRG